MNKMAVLFYSQVSNPQNIPGDWPAKSYIFDPKSETPPPEYTIMLIEEYKLYIRNHQSEYDAWKVQTQQETREKEKKDYSEFYDLFVPWIEYLNENYPEMLNDTIKQLLPKT